MNPHSVTQTCMLAAVAGVVLAAAPAFAGPAALQGTVSHPKGNANLIVYVAKATGAFTPPATAAVMNQKGMMFKPHVMAVLKGSTVDFLNSDAVAHNVFSPDNEGYNLGTWPKGEKRSYTFKSAGAYTQLCSIHPEMEAYILVVDNPYFAVTDAAGAFTIANLPAGHYTLKVWGEKLKTADKKKTFAVDVADGGSTTTLKF